VYLFAGPFSPVSSVILTPIALPTYNHQLLSDDSNFSQYRLETYDLSQYMRLDSSAVKALNLMPETVPGGSSSLTSGNKSMSLYGLLNRTRTAQGSRMLAQWLKQPLLSVSEIETRLDLVEMFINQTELRQTLQDHLKKFPDLHRLGKKFLKQRANLQDVLRVYQVILNLPNLISTLEEHASSSDSDSMDQGRGANEDKAKWLLKEMYVDRLKEYMDGLRRLGEMVETTVDVEAAERHEYVIKAEFDGELQGEILTWRLYFVLFNDCLETDDRWFNFGSL
jgi:DNA mismatch repair protein MSH2